MELTSKSDALYSVHLLSDLMWNDPCVCVCVRARVHVHMCVHMCVCTCVCVHVWCVCARVVCVVLCVLCVCVCVWCVVCVCKCYPLACLCCVSYTHIYLSSSLWFGFSVLSGAHTITSCHPPFKLVHPIHGHLDSSCLCEVG